MQDDNHTTAATKHHHLLSQDELIQYCEKNRIKLTPLRESILMILVTQKQPMTAYQILDELKQTNAKAQVMSVYRVLEYLKEHHLIHRIENLNAFMLCNHLSKTHLSQWLICEICGDAQEWSLPVFQTGINHLEKDTGFSVTSPTIELLGVCRICQTHSPNE